MKKKILIALIIVIILIVGYVIKELVWKNNLQVTIIQYEVGTLNEIKKVNVDDSNKIESFINALKPLSEEEMVNLALANEIVVVCDNIEINIQLGVKHYCYYIDNNNNIKGLSYMPEGLYEWVNEKLK